MKKVIYSINLVNSDKINSLNIKYNEKIAKKKGQKENKEPEDQKKYLNEKIELKANNLPDTVLKDGMERKEQNDFNDNLIKETKLILVDKDDKLSKEINEDKSTCGKDTDTDSIFHKAERRDIKDRIIKHRFSEDSNDMFNKKNESVKCEYKENLQIVNNLIKNSRIDIIIEEEYVNFYIKNTEWFKSYK